MKKIICLISLLVAETLFADVMSYRYEDGNIHFGLPSWVELSDILIDESRINTSFNNLPAIYAICDNKFTFGEEVNQDPRFKIDLPESHSIEFLGTNYSSLTVHEDGRIEFGDEENYYDKRRPYIKVATVLEKDKYVIGKNVEWGLVSQKVDNVLENFIVINFGRFTYPVQGGLHHPPRPCSIQILIYQNGEVQIQYWFHDNHYWDVDDWVTPEFFDGHGSQIADTKKLSPIYVDIYNGDGLRPGWIAKALNSDYAVDITEPEIGAGLHVQMNSESPDLGGIIAYDYSREHPVVGSFSSVNVWTSDFSTKDIAPIFCWYFNEYYNTIDANIPKSLPYESSPLTLEKNDYSYTWDAYKNNPKNKKIVLRTDKTIDFIGAPAFKFQRAQRLEDSREKIYDFYIKMIRYNLAQPQSIQFLPLRIKRNFITINSDGGIIDLPQIKGTPDAGDSYIKTYKLYLGQEINGAIIAAPGYLIHKVIVSRSLDDNTGTVVYDNDKLLLKNTSQLNFTVGKEKREIIINGRMDNVSNVVLRVWYKKCETRELDYVIPAMVKTETYTAPIASPENRINSSAQIMNAFGGIAQKQVKIKGTEYSVHSEYSNGVGQTTRIPMTFIHKSESGDFEYVDMACEGCIIAANAYYYKRPDGAQSNSPLDDIDRPDAENNAFTETRYFNGNSKNSGAISASAGIAKRSFAFNEDSYAQDWVMPASSKYDFIPHEKLDEGTLQNIFRNRSNDASKKDFVLKIYRNADGKHSQEIYNSKGQKEASWFFDGEKELINVYEYDDFGNLTKTYNKDCNQISLNTSYDAQGRVKAIQSNDRGLTQYRYDSKGHLRFVKTPLHGEGEFTAYFFDNLGRKIAVGEVSGVTPSIFENPDVDDTALNGKVRYTSKIIYGKPDIEFLKNLGIEAVLAQSILNKMDFIRADDIGAVVSFDEQEKMTTVKLSEYNRIGEKKYQWIVLGLGEEAIAIQLSYDYNLSSELTHSVFSEWNGSEWVHISTRTREYDSQGRLEKTMEDGAILAKYRYTPNGNVHEKLYYDKGVLVFRKVISRDVYDRPTKISYFDGEDGGDELYSTNLDFKSVESNQVKDVSHEWSSWGDGREFSKNYSYEYDYSGRLTSVTGDLSGSYEYDALGRLTRKVEGNTTVDYLYRADNYRPTDIVITGTSMNRDAFLLYDAAGNVWLDKHNFVAYKNNKYGAPTRITKFTSSPSGISLEMVNNSVGELPDAKFSIDVAYDENGDRVWYSVNDIADNKTGYTRVTLPGVGVYEAPRTNGVNGAFKLVRKDLIAGGYRDASGNARFPVTDAQGNVRSYAMTSGLRSAYDYYAYGTVDELVVDEDGNDNRWQSKEFDGEHGKYYFGARYFDPFFGLWMSPDPAGQFANPYSYGGDPINFIDPNGEFAISSIIIGAAIGAIIGGSAAYANCSDRDECGWEALTSAAVGGAAGAAGGAVGEAFSGLSASYAGAAGWSSLNAGAKATEASLTAAMVNSTIQGSIVGGTTASVQYVLGDHSWNTGHFMLTSFGGMLAGAALGAISAQIRFDASEDFRQSTYQIMEDYAYDKGIDVKDVINYDYELNQKQRAVDYYAYRIRKYTSAKFKYDAISAGTTRGFYNEETKLVSIYDEAFVVDGQYDATSLMSTIDHEMNHITDNEKWIAAAKKNGFNDFSSDGNVAGNGRAFVEASNYYKGIQQGKEFGYSDRVMNYLKGRYHAYAPWHVRIMIESSLY